MHAYIRLIWPFWLKLWNNPFWLKCKDILNLRIIQVQPDLTKYSKHFCHIRDFYMKIPTDMPLQYSNAFFDKNALSILIIKISLSSNLNIFLVQCFNIVVKVIQFKRPFIRPTLSYDHFVKRFLCQLYLLVGLDQNFPSLSSRTRKTETLGFRLVVSWSRTPSRVF